MENVKRTPSGESKHGETPEDENLDKKKEDSASLGDERKPTNVRKVGAGDEDVTGESVSKSELSTQPSADEVSSPTCDEDQTSVFLDDQYLAEAVAFFIFKNTVQELDRETKRLADCLLGQGWLTDKKKRKDLPTFLVKDAHGKTLSKLAGECWSFPVLLRFLPWLAKKCSLSKFEEDENVQAAGEVCQLICEHVENITLLDVWLDNRPAPTPEDIMLELNEYKLILLKLGCKNAARIVAEKQAWLAEEMGKVDFSISVFKKEDVRVEAEVAKMAVVFQAFHYVEDRIHKFCRDSDAEVSLCFAKFLKAEEEKQTVGLAAMLDFIGKELKLLGSKEQLQITELATCMKAVSKNITCLEAGLKKLLSSILEGFKKFHCLKFRRERFEQEEQDILSFLEDFLLDEKGSSWMVAKIFPSSRLKPVYAKRFHHWIPPHREPFIGRRKELKKICTILKRRASNVMITGQSGIGKSSLVQEAAFRLRSAWPSQFVIDASTQFSFLASLSQVVTHYGFLSEEKQLHAGVLKAYKIFLKLSDHRARALLILENCNSEDLTNYFTLPRCGHVALIVVTRQPDKVFTKRQQGMMHLTIELSRFSSAESKECFAELTGQEKTPVEVLEMHRVVLSHLNNFPLAIQVAKALLKNFTNECVAKYQTFFEEHSHHNIDPTKMIGLASSSENASVILTLISFSLRIIHGRQDLQDLVYLTALLACPSNPSLPSPPDVGIETEKSLFMLEQLGLLVEEHYDVGERPCFRMHALIANTLQSKMLTLPIEDCLTHLGRSFRMLGMCLSGEDGLDRVSKDKVAFSAMCLEYEGTLKSLIERLSEKTTDSSEQSALFFFYGELLFVLATFSGALWRSSNPRFAVNPALTFDLFQKSLNVYSYLNQSSEFCRTFKIYQEYLICYRSREDRTRRLNDMLTLAVACGFENDVVLINEERCGLSALANAVLEKDDLNLDWASLYISHAGTVLQSPLARYNLSREKASCLIKQGRFEEANGTLLRSLRETEHFFGKDSARYGKVLHFLGWNCLEQGNKGQAVKYFTKAVRILEKYKNVEEYLMFCLIDLGVATLVDKSKPEVARSYLNKALAHVEMNSGRESKLYSTALSKMADFEEALGNVTKAVELRSEILPKYRDAGTSNLNVVEPEGDSTSPNPSSTSQKRKKKKKKSKTKGASAAKDGDSSDIDKS